MALRISASAAVPVRRFFFPSSVREVHLKFEKKIRRPSWVSGVQMFTSRAKYVGPILTAVFPCTLRPQQLAVFPAYFQFTHSRTTSNPFNQSKIPGAGGLDGDASRPDCERSRNQGAFGGRAHTTAQNCRSRSARTLAYCYNDARVIEFVWTNLVTNRLKGGARSFED